MKFNPPLLNNLAKKVFKGVPETKKELWGGEFWTDGYYFATAIDRGDRGVVEKYIQKQDRQAALCSLARVFHKVMLSNGGTS